MKRNKREKMRNTSRSLNEDEETDILLTHNWEPCQDDRAARPLLYQRYQSSALQHQKTANKTVDTEPGYKINIQE